MAFLTIVACSQQPGSSSKPAIEPADIDIDRLAPNIDVQTAAALLGSEDVVFLDVREQWEYDSGHIPGITLIPTSEFESRVGEVPTDKTVIITCQSGRRSSMVDAFLRDQGYDNIHNMEGGFAAWESAGFEVAR